MKFRTDLRYRVTLAFALLGAIVSAGVAGVFYLLTIDMEQRLIAETLSAELEDYISRYAVDPATPPPSSTTIRTYVLGPDRHPAPAPLDALKAGLHQVEIGNRHYFAAVEEAGGLRFVVLYDDAPIRHRESRFRLFFLIGITVMTLISAMLGSWAAGRVISPVAELARRVGRLGPEGSPGPLADNFPDDEVGELARDFDAYLQRLAAFIERERAFTSDVSHELRTPLAVISGATEVLLADEGLDEARRQRVERIARSVQEISELIDALLLLARENRDQPATGACDVGDLLEQVIDSHRHILRRKSVEVILSVESPMSMCVECTLLRVVLANLVRNAFSYTERGQVSIRLEGRVLTVGDTGSGIPAGRLQRVFEHYYSGPSGGEGIGLSLVRRICERYGWRIEISSREGHGTLIRLFFTEP